MPALNRKKLEVFHQNLFEKSKNEALSFPSFKSKTIESYSADFRASIPKNFKITDLNKLVLNIHKNRVLLYGDFHTLRQSQKGFVRLLKEIKDTDPNQPVAVFVEMFSYEHTHLIEKYMKNLISDEEFLQQVDYYNQWGFSWENYRMIPDFCRQHQIPLIGLNTKFGGKDSLASRDKFAAKLISEYHLKHPTHLVFCLIGEYHLGDSSLPGSLNQTETQHTRVFTNIDEFFFKPRIDIAEHTAYLYLKSNSFCILNSPPWVKWQSYCLWEETREFLAINDCYNAIEEEELIYGEDAVEVDSQIRDLAIHLAGFFHLNHSEFEIDRFSVINNPDQAVFNRLKARSKFNKSAMATAIERLSIDGYYFDCQSDTILVTDLSFNTLSKIAGQHLHNSYRIYSMAKLDDTERFIFRTLNVASGQIAALLLNPKIKHKSLEYLTDFCYSNRRKRLSGAALHKLSGVKAVIKIIGSDKTKLPTQRILKLNAEQDYFLNHEISRNLGVVIGHIIYKACMEHQISFNTLPNIFASAKSRDQMPNVFFDLIKLVLMLEI